MPNGFYIEFQFSDRAAKGVAVHAELARGLALIPIVLLQNGDNKSFLELPDGFRVQDAAFVHLQYQSFKLVLHSASL